MHVVRDLKRCDLNPADFELEPRLEEDDLPRNSNLSLFKLRNRFPHEVYGDAQLPCQGCTAARMHMVLVSMRDQNSANGSRIDACCFHSASNLDRAEPGIEEQIAFGSVDDGSVAAAAAAEDRAAEFGRLNRGIGHDVITGGVLSEVKMTDLCFATEI